MYLRGCIFYDNSKSKILHKLAYLLNDMHKKYVDTREIRNRFIGLKRSWYLRKSALWYIITSLIFSYLCLVT